MIIALYKLNFNYGSRIYTNLLIEQVNMGVLSDNILNMWNGVLEKGTG